jgi:hypothetical protein
MPIYKGHGHIELPCEPEGGRFALIARNYSVASHAWVLPGIDIS